MAANLESRAEEIAPPSASVAGRFLCATLCIIALLATSFLIHSVLPPSIPEGVASKLKFFSAHKDEFDTLFIGTSRVYYALSPEIFDGVTRASGIPTRSFNFGVDGMHPPENFYVVEQILKTKPQNLKWVFLETEDIQTKWDNALGTQRVLYWHDWRRTALTLKKALNPKGNARWYGRVARLWLARRDLILNLALFQKQFTNVGRAADFFSTPDANQVLLDQLELGPSHDGYRLAGSGMDAKRAAEFLEKLAGEVRQARPKLIDPYAENAYRDCAAHLRALGATPIFVVTPLVWQYSLRFRQTPPGPFLSFNDSKKYPALYDTNNRIDDGHLAKEGAEEFSRMLAQEIVQRAPGLK